VRYLPGGNSLIFKMAKSCIEGEALGQDDETDFLCLSFSSPDYAGHKFAPNSIEVEDMFLRFDGELDKFLNYLDSEIGKGAYTVFLTADHGGAHNPVYMQNMGIPAGNMNEADNEPRLNALLKVKFGFDTLIRSVYNYQVYFNEEKIKAAGIKREEVKSTVINWLKTQEGVTYVADLENLSSIILPDAIKTMIINGYYAKRSGVIQVIYEPGWLSDDIPTGTTHGTWNPHDTHIPLLWYGWGISKGNTYRTINMTDIAPTLAALLHIQMPNGNIGEVITELMLDK
jgi:predicted AlkP superfamily pyrophosphatase or phosphodiesterase